MRPFKLRNFVSITLFFSFFVITISGLVLYVAPPGRVARWSWWTVAYLSKKQWVEQHIMFSFVFIIGSLLHVFLINKKTFFSYLRRKGKTTQNTRELILASLLFLFIGIGTYKNIFPLRSIIGYGGKIAKQWIKKGNKPPRPHAEEYTMERLAKEILEEDVDILLQTLRDIGYSVNKETTLEALSITHNKSPLKIYEEIIMGIHKQKP